MIPQVINYCWFGEKRIPNNLKKYLRTWKEKCPNYKIKLWNEKNYNINSNIFVKDAYDTKNWAFVSDYARLDIIYNYGGFYLDTDVELLKGLEEIANNEAFFAIQQNGCYINTGLCFGAEKGNRVVKDLLNSYNDLEFKETDKYKLACPILNTKVLEKYGFVKKNVNQIIENNVHIYSSEYFDPISPDTNTNLLSDNTISIHHYSATWMSNKTIIKRRFVNFIGQSKMNKIKRTLKIGD